MFHVGISAFCLMSDNCHILVQTPAANLSREMRHLNGVFTQRYNRRRNTDGQFVLQRKRHLNRDLGLQCTTKDQNCYRTLLNGVSTELKFEVLGERTMSGKKVAPISYLGERRMLAQVGEREVNGKALLSCETLWRDE